MRCSKCEGVIEVLLIALPLIHERLTDLEEREKQRFLRKIETTTNKLDRLLEK